MFSPSICRVVFAATIGWFSFPVAQGADPNAKVEPKLVVQTGHAGYVWAAVQTADGKQVVTYGGDVHIGTVCAWDTKTGRMLRTWRTPKPSSVRESALAVSPDGSRVIVATGSEFSLHDGESGFVLFKGASRARYAFEIKDALLPKGGVYAPIPLAFAPDGKTVLTPDGDASATACLRDATTGRTLLRLTGHAGTLTAVAYLPANQGYVTGSTDATVRIWNAAGKETRKLEGHFSAVMGVSISADGGRAAILDATGRLKVWNITNGTEVSRIDIWTIGLNAVSVAISPDGQTLASAHRVEAKGTLCLWDVESGMRRASPEPEKPYQKAINFATFSPDGSRLFVRLGNNTVGLIDPITYAVIRPFQRLVSPIRAICVSPGNSFIFVAGDDGVVLRWNTVTGGIDHRFTGHLGRINALALSPDGGTLLSVGADQTGRLWSATSGKQLYLLRGHTDEVHAAAFSPKGDLVLTGGRDNTARLWDVKTGKEVRQLGPNLTWITAAAFTPDGNRAVTTSPDIDLSPGKDEKARLWDVGTGKFVRRYEYHNGGIESVAVSPDSRRILTSSDDRIGRIWDLDSGKLLVKLTGHPEAVKTVAFFTDKRALTGGMDGTARIWDAATGKELVRLDGHTGRIGCVMGMPDGKRVLTGSDDGTIRIWDEDGKELVQMVGLAGGGWATATPEGRFDTNDLDAIRGLHWVMPDEPLRALSPEVFMRDYYEPKLLARVLAGEKFKPVRSLAELNRVQPGVRVAKVTPSAEQPDEVSVTVEVGGRERVFDRPGGPVLLQSGAFDLHLFRDGQLVGQRPDTLALDPKTGRATVTFDRVRLPRTEGKKAVEFSAYAFNADRVKSDTHRLTHPIPANLTARKGTAYVVCVGVNGFDDPKWNLQFAAPDARVMADTLRGVLTKSEQFDKVVVVPLVSEPRLDKDGKPVGVTSTATKENLRLVIAALAGQKPDARLVKDVPAAADLREARPEDLVILTFSTHGHNGAAGRFYLLPSDIGAGHDGKVTDALLQRCVSTDDLSEWLRGVDAGEMVMVVDACHSAGSVEADGFKPGPMGSRGLGQLAYNKRMRILAASQANDVAFEDRKIGHGLLTYALCHNGLTEGKADIAPVDQRITLGEWLRYGERRVPVLADEVRLVSVTGRGLRKVGQKQTAAQQPSLFDFTRGADAVTLTKLAP